MLILDGTIGSDICSFLARLQEETLACKIELYEHWLHENTTCSDHNHEHPEGIIYLRVMPEIAYARLQKRALLEQDSASLDHIRTVYMEKDQLFIENKNNSHALEHLPVLVLNGNIDFQTDFSQFYNHLFYIRRFLKQIQESKEIALGIHKKKMPHRRCC
jgi:deoxyadenosine/deoxycytidine kinase